MTYPAPRVESWVRMTTLPSVFQVVTQTLQNATDTIYNSKRMGPFNACKPKVSSASDRFCSCTKWNISSSLFWLCSYIILLYLARICQESTCSSGELLGQWNMSSSTKLCQSEPLSQHHVHITPLHILCPKIYCEHETILLTELKQFTKKRTQVLNYTHLITRTWASHTT